MKIKTGLVLFLIAVLAVSVWFNFRAAKKTVRPEKETVFKMVKPDTVTIIDTVETIKKIKVFEAMPEPKKVEAYAAAVTKREYKETFSRSGLKVEVLAKTTGVLDSVSVSVVQKQENAFYLGLELGGGSDLIRTELKAHLIKRKTIYSVGYDFNNKAITGGIAFKIF